MKVTIIGDFQSERSVNLFEGSVATHELERKQVGKRNSGYVNAVPGSGLSCSDTAMPELDISYFFPNNIAAEFVLGTT